jgi:hypothetical protein
VFQIVDRALVPVSLSTAEAEPRTIAFSETLPDTTHSGFPVLVTGTVKVVRDIRKTGILLTLAPDGQRKPTVEDQRRFADGLAAGTERLKVITIHLYDADGYMAGDPVYLPLSNQPWNRVVDEKGMTTAYEYKARQKADADENADIKTVSVGWSAIEKRPTPVSQSTEPPMPPNYPGPATDAAATAADAGDTAAAGDAAAARQ